MLLVIITTIFIALTCQMLFLYNDGGGGDDVYAGVDKYINNKQYYDNEYLPLHS